MPRRVNFILALLVLPLCVIAVRAQELGILAEGSYDDTVQSSKAVAPGVDWVHAPHWTMRGVSGGGFIVQEAHVMNDKDNKLVQVLGFSKDWKPASTSLKMYLKDSPEPFMSLACEYHQDAISCDAFDNGKATRGSLHVEGPKVLLPPGFTADIFWLTAAECIQAERTPGKVTNVAEVSVADNPATSVLKLEVIESVPVEYIGQEDLTITLGTMRAHKFRMQDSTVWTADSGLVLAMTVGGTGDRGRMELSSFEDNAHLLVPAKTKP